MVQSKSNFGTIGTEHSPIYIYIYIYIYSPLEIRITLEPARPQLHHPAACVISQQYSSATFVTLCVHFRKEKFGVFKKCYIFHLLNSVRLRLRTSGRVCTSICFCDTSFTQFPFQDQFLVINYSIPRNTC